MHRRELGLVVAVYMLACGGGLPPTQLATGAQGAAASARGSKVAATEAGARALLPVEPGSGLEFELRPGKVARPVETRARSVAGTRVSNAEADRLLAQLPALPAASALDASFAKRSASLAPPTAVTETLAAFPAAAGPRSAPAPARVPLEVVRVEPTGDVPIAPELLVAFNQPMVALASHEASVASVPVTLTPQPPGKWRWLGTRTLAFTPIERLPMATDYTVTIARGIRSADGSVLGQGLTHRFRTPPPELAAVSVAPERERMRRVPVVVAQFDQAIDRDALVQQTDFCFRGGCTDARSATAEEIAAEPSARDLWQATVADQLEPRAVAIAPVHALPYDSRITVRFGQVPSAEGPRRGAAIAAELVTHGPLRVRRVRCGYENGRCAPNDPWLIEFSNPIAEDSLDLAAFGVAPDAQRVGVSWGGAVVHLQVETRARTKYALTVPAGVRDVFGQTLGATAAHAVSVGDPRPELHGLEPVTVLDPRGPRELQVASIGVDELRVRVRRAGPADFGAYAEFLSRHPSAAGVLPGTAAHERVLKVADTLANTITKVDLASVLPGGVGHAIVVVEPTRWRDRHKPSLRTWVQSTQLALDVLSDREHLNVWVTRLADGRPVPAAEVAIEPGGVTGKTDARGFAQLGLPASGGTRGRVAIARAGGDSAFYPERLWQGRRQPSDWKLRAAQEDLRWFAFDDRGAYRPGETVHVKGWLRATEGGAGGKLALPGGVSHVSYRVQSSGGHELARGQARLSAAGGFDLSFALPREVDLGHALVELEARMDGRTHKSGRGILVEEFRRPEYEVTLHAADATHFAGDLISLRTEARYYTGGPLVGSPVELTVSAGRAQFIPPNRGDYSFGEPPPWWFWDMRGPGMVRVAPPPKTLRLRTDGSGDAALEIATGRADPAYPHSLHVVTSVRDVNRQVWSDEKSLLVHPASTYVGLRLQRAFVSQGEALEVDVVTVDLDGKDVKGRKVELRGVRREHGRSQGKAIVREHDVQTCAFTSSGAVQRCAFRPSSAGSYEIVARVSDDRGRPNQTQVMTWVAGPHTAGPEALAADAVQIIPDRKEYAPGETAELLLLAPFSPADALVTIERDGVLRSEHVRMTAATHTLRVPIAKEHAPTLHVRVLLAGARAEPGGAGSAPAFAQGMATLPISLADKRLAVNVQPGAVEVEPGGSTHVQVEIRDAANHAVEGAEVAVLVVDEAVLALTDYTPGDPLAAMHPFVYSGADLGQTRAFVRLREAIRAQLTRTGAAEGSIGLGSGGAGVMRARRVLKTSSGDVMLQSAAANAVPDRDAGGAVRGVGRKPMLRVNFSPIALFAPKLVTDPSGRARVALTLPDDLTRYRVFALASAGAERFGHGESAVTARKPLMVRPSAPRFLNLGDRFELPVVVENQTASAQSVLVAVRAANAALGDGRGRRVEVPARDRVEVRLPITTRAPGRALLQVAAQGKHGADAAQLDLPVWTPGTDEAFATYGSLAGEGAIAQPITVPADAFVEFGGLEIGTSSTQIAALTDAVLYVDDYPFDGSEQLASRIITLLALRDVLAAFAVAGAPTAQEARIRARDAAQRLLQLQNGDGGFAWWQRGDESAPYNTVHALHALVRARAAGVPDLDSAIDFARHAVPTIFAQQKIEPAALRTLRAYVAYVDMLAGRDAGATVDRLFREVQARGHSIEALGFMLSAIAGKRDRATLARELVAALSARASETAGAAQFNEHYDAGAHLILHSEQRSDAVALEGLMRAVPGHDLAPKLAKGLLAHRKKGRWLNTQENVFAALALRAYFDHHERETPAFEARVFLGSILAQSARYEGRSTQQTSTQVPMAYLAQKARGPLVLHKVGTGRMYYRLGLRYAPKALALPAENQGFEIERIYEGADDPADVSRDAAGVWYVKAGARVRVRVGMIARARRHHVALVDPLAAGFEPIQASLRVNAVPPDEHGVPPCPVCKRISWPAPWYDHENLRDDRAEAFSALLGAGVYTYSYTVRATTPGEFVVPPAKAEEMYMPETFGRSASDRVIVR
jgi:hypothetical protein